MYRIKRWSNRNIDLRPLRVADAALFFPTCSRVVILLVQRNVYHRWIVVEDFLCSVAVMDIPIYDQHALEAVMPCEMACRDGNVVEQTKAHRVIRSCMMTGWSHCCKCILKSSLHDSTDGLDCRSRCKHRCIE